MTFHNYSGGPHVKSQVPKSHLDKYVLSLQVVFNVKDSSPMQFKLASRACNELPVLHSARRVHGTCQQT